MIKKTFFQELMDRLATIPGVRDASAALSLPTKKAIYTNIMKVEGVRLPDEDLWPDGCTAAERDSGLFSDAGHPVAERA
jgi:hypothetical protein